MFAAMTIGPNLMKMTKFYYEANLGDLGIAHGIVHAQDEVDARINIETRHKRLCSTAKVDYPDNLHIEQYCSDHDYYINNGYYINYV